MAGVTVVAIHVPSGTQYGALTNADGFYSINGMRPGGPYIIEVSFVGYAKKTLSEIYISLGEAFIMNTSVAEVSAQLGEVVVTGTKPPIYNSEKNGSSINISNVQMVAVDYQIIVDWVKTNKEATLIDSYGTQEFYHAAGSYYSNFDLRPGKWDTSVFSTWQDAIKAAIGVALLPSKFPAAVAQVNGTNVNYIVTFATYSAPIGTFTIKFQCTKSGPNPEFTFVEGPTAL